MIRTQIQLTEEQARALRKLAAAEGRSMAELIRESLDLYITSDPASVPEEVRNNALGLIGKHSSGTSDLSKSHDLYLAKDLAR